MPKCPECSHSWKNKAKVCPNLIAKTASKMLKRRLHKYKENTRDYVNSINTRTEFSTTNIISFNNVGGHTEGDVYRLVCDGLVCEGVLSKTRFSTRGHKYVKNGNVTMCGNCREGKNKKGQLETACLFDWNTAKEIEVE